MSALGDVARVALLVLNLLFLAYFLVVSALQVLLVAISALELRRQSRLGSALQLGSLLSSPVAPTVSVLAPAYNEESSIAASVRALLALNYPRLQVVVINDGSKDRTIEVLRREFHLVDVHPGVDPALPTARIRSVLRSAAAPSLVVIDKDNGGKADALNTGLNVATGDLVCAIDADTLIEPDALLRVVRPFLGASDVVGAGGTIRVANESAISAGRVLHPRVPSKPIAGIQVVEYLRAFHLGRLAWNRLGGNLIVSGAFGLFRRQDTLRAGGYLAETVGEDMELVVRLRRRGIEAGTASRVLFVPDPVAWTEVPESIRVLGRQRDRWQRGLADVIRRHLPLLGNPRFGVVGLLLMPYFTVIELLGPVIELVGLLATGAGLWLGVVDLQFVLLLLLIGYGWAIPISLTAVLLDQLAYRRYQRRRDRALLLLWATLENLGYRQLSVVWRLRGLYRYLRGRNDWGVMTRRGFSAPPQA